MTNTLALILATALVAGVLADVILADAENLLFLSKKLMELMAKCTVNGSDDSMQPEQQSDNPADDSN